MTLDDLKGLGIVVGRISDVELGNKSIACVGKMTSGGVKSDDGRYWIGDNDLEAGMRCYDASNFGGDVPESSKDAPLVRAEEG